MAPLTVSARTTKPGRSFQVAEAELSAGGQVVVRARAVRLRRGQVELPALAGDHEAPPAAPESGRGDPFPAGGGHAEGFHLTAMDIRFLGDAGFGRGPARAWFRLTRPLIDDEPAQRPGPDGRGGRLRQRHLARGRLRGLSVRQHRPHGAPASRARRGMGAARRAHAPGAPRRRTGATRPSATSAAGSGCPRNRCSSPHVDGRGDRRHRAAR